MEKLSLSAFVSRNGQEKAAEAFNCGQSAISKAISSGRNITVTIFENGKVIAEELKPFPSSKREVQVI
ncbi:MULTISPECIES: Cro/CI family transcriptional regulator [Rosenbergiella]|uniref:Cro protein n=1 Tax=Rosenbergiella nectarea TaxID=988801 RepID=A0A1H9N2L8_9GAMM|nr:MULTISPECIES: Cro/CI family transcriptional regulator [Rosenbergiella]SER30071.1 Cro protein [Rosenbergiella nectarea]